MIPNQLMTVGKPLISLVFMLRLVILGANRAQIVFFRHFCKT